MIIPQTRLFDLCKSYFLYFFIRYWSSGQLLLEERWQDHPKGAPETPARANQVPDRWQTAQSDQDNPTTATGRQSSSDLGIYALKITVLYTVFNSSVGFSYMTKLKYLKANHCTTLKDTNHLNKQTLKDVIKCYKTWTSHTSVTH